MASEDWRDENGNTISIKVALDNPFYRHKSVEKFKKRLNEWEYEFVVSIHKRYKLSEKQIKIAQNIFCKLYPNSSYNY